MLHELTSKQIKNECFRVITGVMKLDECNREWLEERVDIFARGAHCTRERAKIILGLSKEQCECDIPSCYPECTCSNCHKWFNPERIKKVQP